LAVNAVQTDQPLSKDEVNNQPKQKMETKNMTTLDLRKSIGPSPLRRGLLLIPLVLACFALSQTARAQLPSPAPDGGYPGFNTAEGDGALTSNTTGSFNTATGAGALTSNTTGEGNTANGYIALSGNTTGNGNTASGYQTLIVNTTGERNTADGLDALFSNTTGSFNTADGGSALASNTTGGSNTANGANALINNTTGNSNTANGLYALQNNITGSNNIALGSFAGTNLTTGDNNIDIGNGGVAAEANTIRVGTGGFQTRAFMAGIYGTPVSGGPVKISSSGQLGVAPSSARFKQDIYSMDKASEAILALKPVTFHYKKELDPEGVPQFGLVAEQVEKVNPDLVARDGQGKVYTVRYEAVNAMLLNEFLKQHRQVQEQQKQIKNLTAQLKEQASQIQEVNDKVEMSRPAPRVVDTNQ
jgi:hypothetical protein